MNASKKTSVLVADDDPRLLKLVQRNLELNGYRVLTAANGRVISEIAPKIASPAASEGLAR